MTTMTAEHSAREKKCGCGCDGKSDCCELECLVQPRFFCGQLLADQDLTALVDWVKAKGGLSRYRHGWGVVCGLDVHCGGKGSVTVTPGYALDCCGRDVVVCKETTLDLTTCWQRDGDPCGNGALQRTRTPQANGGEAVFSSGSASFGGFGIPAEQVQAVDVYIRYSESQSDASTALARGGCGGAAGCEYTRVHEGAQLYCQPASDCLDPNVAVVTAWDEAYVQGLTEMFDAFSAMQGLQDPRRRLGRLLAWLKEHQLSTFCYVRELLCDLQSDEGELPERWFESAVFLIVQDWRNQYFRALCAGCGPETGVRLARVWLWMRRVDGKEKFSTLSVEAHSPFRRALEKDGSPAPAGYVNLAPYVWQPVDGAATSLRALGFTDIQAQELAFADLAALRGTFVRNHSLFIRHGVESTGSLSLSYFVDHCGIQRVVGLTTRRVFDEDHTGVPPIKPEPAPNNAIEAAPNAATPPSGRKSRSGRQ